MDHELGSHKAHDFVWGGIRHLWGIFFHVMHAMDDDSMVEAIGMGSIVIGVETKGIRNKVCITCVLHMPKLQANLLSVSKFLSNILNMRMTTWLQQLDAKGIYTKWPSQMYAERMRPISCVHVWEAIHWSFGVADSNIWMWVFMYSKSWWGA